jgi:hypothetical protein
MTRLFVLFCAAVLGASGSVACTAQVYGRASSPPPPPPALVIHADVGAGADVTAAAYASPNPDVEDTNVFVAPLAAYGMWTTVEPYGQVWVPRVPPGWVPYSDGHWAYTDVGWTWVSNEPWGWAAFHYGRWYRDPFYHWVWVPGTHWAPAWVAWRYGGHEVGWAPLPPRAHWQAGLGLSLGPGQLEAYIAPHDWHFVHERFFGDRDLRRHYQPRDRNFVFVRETRNVTDYRVVNRRIVDRGVDVRHVERARGARLPRMTIVGRHEPGRSEIRGDHEIALYVPPGRHRGVEREYARGNRGFVASSRPGHERPRAQRPAHRAQPERQSLADRRRALERDRLHQRQAEYAGRAERSRAHRGSPRATQERRRQPERRVSPQRAEHRGFERGDRARAPSAERGRRQVQAPGPTPGRSARRETRHERHR